MIILSSPTIFLVIFLVIIAPFLLWPIEIFFPYPHIVEELAKAILVYLLLSLPLKPKIFGAILIGVLFSLTETALYAFKIPPGNFQILLSRLLLTLPMHTATSLIILISSLFNKKLIYLGILLTILLHYFFNLYVSSIPTR